jgi:hypothetical protein
MNLFKKKEKKVSSVSTITVEVNKPSQQWKLIADKIHNIVNK